MLTYLGSRESQGKYGEKSDEMLSEHGEEVVI
jgi:hypothetical protein